MMIRGLILIGLIGQGTLCAQTFPTASIGKEITAADIFPRLAEEPGGGNSPADGDNPQRSFVRDLFACDPPLDRLWSFEFGVGVISDNTPADYLKPRLNKLHGPGGGVTYNFTVSRRIYQFNW